MRWRGHPSWSGLDGGGEAPLQAVVEPNIQPLVGPSRTSPTLLSQDEVARTRRPICFGAFPAVSASGEGGGTRSWLVLAEKELREVPMAGNVEPRVTNFASLRAEAAAQMDGFATPVSVLSGDQALVPALSMASTQPGAMYPPALATSLLLGPGSGAMSETPLKLMVDLTRDIGQGSLSVPVADTVGSSGRCRERDSPALGLAIVLDTTKAGLADASVGLRGGDSTRGGEGGRMCFAAGSCSREDGDLSLGPLSKVDLPVVGCALLDGGSEVGGGMEEGVGVKIAPGSELLELEPCKARGEPVTEIDEDGVGWCLERVPHAWRRRERRTLLLSSRSEDGMGVEAEDPWSSIGRPSSFSLLDRSFAVSLGVIPPHRMNKKCVK